jgi:hypothetical protein
MKYMTPELIARFRSEDDAVAEPAAIEWERQCEAYRKHLQEIRAGLSRGAKLLSRRYYLHNAKALAMAADKVPYFSIFLELDTPAESASETRLELRYRLVGGLHKGYEMVKHEALAGDGKPLAWWLYDEIDLSRGEVPAMTHSILFTGGYEIRLTFFAVSCRRLDFLSLPTNDDGVVDVTLMESWVRLPA